jgi:hypothetical protein
VTKNPFKAIVTYLQLNIASTRFEMHLRALELMGRRHFFPAEDCLKIYGLAITKNLL